MKVEERLLNYVKVWTTSDELSQTTPSSSIQFDLGRMLEKELKDLGLRDVVLTDQCYLYGLHCPHGYSPRLQWQGCKSSDYSGL